MLIGQESWNVGGLEEGWRTSFGAAQHEIDDIKSCLEQFLGSGGPQAVPSQWFFGHSSSSETVSDSSPGKAGNKNGFAQSN